MEGLPAPSSQPGGFLKFLSRLHVWGRRVLGQDTDILPNAVDFLTRPYAYSIAKAQRQLGYQPKISLEEGMQRTHEWLSKTDITKLI